MEDTTLIIQTFISENRKPLAGYIRQKLLTSGAKPYLDKLGKAGIEELENESAGILLDLTCSLMSRIKNQKIQSEDVLSKLPAQVRTTIKLPRSSSYHDIMNTLKKPKE